MPKTGRRTGPSRADGAVQAPTVLSFGGTDLELLGPNADLSVGGTLRVRGVEMTPADLEDLPAAVSPFDGAETVPVEQDGVAVRATTAQLAPGPLEVLKGMTRTRNRVGEDFEDFKTTVTADATLIGSTTLQSSLSGTGAQIAQGQDFLQSELGVLDLTTGTTTTGRCATQAAGAWLYLFQPTLYQACGARVRLQTASDGTNTYRVHVGFCALNTATPTDGYYFESPAAAGNWHAVIRDDSADLANIDTGVAADFGAPGGWHVYVVEFDPDFGGFRFYIDGAVVASDTVNEPDLLAPITNFGVGIFKTAGTTSRIVECDYLSYNVPDARAFYNLP